MKKKLNCVLLVDDDEPTNFLSRMLLEEANCTEHIEVAHSGIEALDYLESSETTDEDHDIYVRPDLIFLDINMPAMNGWEFLEEYKNLEKDKKGKIVVVMLTTSLNPDDSARAKGIPDISDFESKPLTSEKLGKILRKHFG
ncbi:MAG TPA: response regulator [Chitinophagaceae bacterium]|nr:response regulator [Chitinophagaceae bacterium]